MTRHTEIPKKEAKAKKGPIILIGAVLLVCLLCCGWFVAGDTLGGLGGTGAERTVANFQGTGPAVTSWFHLQSGQASFDYKMDAYREYAGNFIVNLLDKNGQYVDMVINDTGDCDGRGRARIRVPGKYQLLVDVADGTWQISVRQ